MHEQLEAVTGERVAALEAVESERVKSQEAGLETSRSPGSERYTPALQEHVFRCRTTEADD